MNLISKGLVVVLSIGLVLLKKEKKYIMFLMFDLCLSICYFWNFWK